METDKPVDPKSSSDSEVGADGPDMFEALYPIKSKWPVQTVDDTPDEDKEELGGQAMT